jgi:hypothetical protein
MAKNVEKNLSHVKGKQVPSLGDGVEERPLERLSRNGQVQGARNPEE